MFQIKTRKIPKVTQRTNACEKNGSVKTSSLQSLRNPLLPIKNAVEDKARNIAQLKPNEQLVSDSLRLIFIAPQLPHPCEIEIWNELSNALGAWATVVTAQTELQNFNQMKASLGSNVPWILSVKGLETMSDNHTFLGGLENELTDADVVIAVGESALSSFQAMKSRRALQHRLVVWQNSPRPPKACAELRYKQRSGDLKIQRESTIRKEVLKHCDALLTFDKDSSHWAFLEDVSPQRLRRIPRGLNTKRFNVDLTASIRTEMRAGLGLPEADFIFLQSGPLEIESGALDSVYAFKNLIQSWPQYQGTTKLVFCGTGSAGADIKQAVVEFGLDEHVYFLNPQSEETLHILGNQLSNLLPLCDAVIHNPLSVVNSSPGKNLDCTYDILCGLASGLTLVSNGNGWAGEWLGRFYKTFGAGNIHSQSKLMRESIEKQDRLGSLKKAIRMSIENELSHTKTVAELTKVIRGLGEINLEIDDTFPEILKSIEKFNQSKQYIDAIKLIEKAFSFPQLTAYQKAQLFRIVGDCFTKLGDLESGKENYLRSLELDSYQAKTLIGLGTISLQEQQYTIAVPQFQRAVSLDPKDDMAHLGLGLAFEGLGEKIEAHRWSAKACRLNPVSTVAIFNVVKLSYEIGEFDEARDIVLCYVNKNPSDLNMKFSLGGIEFKLGNYKEARELMKDILRLDPGNQRALGLTEQVDIQERTLKVSRKQA